MSVRDPSEGGVNPSIFVPAYTQSMSRSTSGGSDAQDVTRLLTPHYDPGREHLSPQVDMKREGGMTYWGRGAAHTSQFGEVGQYAQGHGQFALSAERGGETDYEREREAQIMSNRQLFQDVGLGVVQTSVRSGRCCHLRPVIRSLERHGEV